MQVAEEILCQLGGRRFILMTGVKDFHTDDGENLVMTLPRNQSGANRLEIKLNAMDTYDVEFYRYSPPRLRKKDWTWIESKRKQICKYTDIYCDQLQELFREVTGFETRMPRIIGINC